MSTMFNEFELSAMAYPNGRIAVLLAQYPDHTQEEHDELVSFAMSASPEEMRNLRSIPALRGKLDRLLRDQPGHSGTGARQSWWIAAAAAAAGLIVFWLL